MRQTPQTSAAGGINEATSFYLPGVEESITSLAALEKALKPRTSVPTQRYARFLSLDDETLANAGVTTNFAAQHLKQMLEDLRGRSEHVDSMLAGIGSGFFSLDHDWRGVFQALTGTGIRAAPFQLVAISDYRRYLLHCLDALNQISADRLQSALFEESASQGEDCTQLATVSSAAYDSSRNSKEVLVRDLVRLPKGTTLQLRQGREGPFEIWLGKHRFRVESWSGASLVDEQGNGADLHDGRNIVGRALYNDVIVDGHFRDVSRRHLIIDLDDGLPSAITDLSSAGTYISRALVEVAA